MDLEKNIMLVIKQARNWGKGSPFKLTIQMQMQMFLVMRDYKLCFEYI